MRGMRPTKKFRALLTTVLFLLTCTPLVAQSAPTEGALQFGELGELKLRNGAVIQDFRLGYRTLGKLNAEKSNAVLWPSWLGGKSEDLLQFIGPGKVIDSNRYFAILVDAIGDGVSSSPSNSRKQPLGKFPEFGIRDMVESEHRLAAEVLHLPHLRAVIGASMGGMQTFEWVVAYPDFVELAIPIAGSLQSTSFDKLLWTAQIDAMELDPAWNHGNPTGPMDRGIALAEEIGSMNLTSPAYRVANTSSGGFDEFVAGIRKTYKGDGGNVWDRIRQRQAIMALDIPAELGVPLEGVPAKVHASVLVIVSPQDLMVNPESAMKFAAAAGAALLKLDSPCGHIATSCISVGPIVDRFLTAPSSVHNEILNH
jgi:pimeloyl-ACP methyl ester carboxylesterase